MGLAVLTELQTKWDSERITWTLTFDAVVFSAPGIRLIYRAGFGIRDLTATQEAILYSFLLGSKEARVVQWWGHSVELTSTPYVACPPSSLLHQSNGSTINSSLNPTVKSHNRIPCLARELNWTLSLEKINGLSLCKVYQVPPSAKAKGHAREKGRREGAHNAYSFIAP